MRTEQFFREFPTHLYNRGGDKDSDLYEEFTPILGKINSITLGHVADRSFFLGVMLTFTMADSGGVGTDISINMSDSCKYETEMERLEAYSILVNFIQDMLIDAKKDSFNKLAGTPVQLFFEDKGLIGDKLIGFRILKEVL